MGLDSSEPPIVKEAVDFIRRDAGRVRARIRAEQKLRRVLPVEVVDGLENGVDRLWWRARNLPPGQRDFIAKATGGYLAMASALVISSLLNPRKGH